MIVGGGAYVLTAGNKESKYFLDVYSGLRLIHLKITFTFVVSFGRSLS